ncbi:MAG: hypothetical protein KAU22_07805, partial [Desulfuromonadales bacterium]|nr:hypothetical protein [Desulfuromonadales bacterium]
MKIISNYEDDDQADVRLTPFVGVVGDRPRSGDKIQKLFSDVQTIGEADLQGYHYMSFSGVADGDTLETPNTIIYENTGENIAALYIELAIMEEDSISLEDDDMIGVFSQTIKLEEIFNKNAQFKWTHLDGSNYQLVITDYPVYNSSNQLSLENPLSDDFEQQKEHNQNRKASALVSITIDLIMGDISTPFPLVDTSLDVG